MVHLFVAMYYFENAYVLYFVKNNGPVFCWVRRGTVVHLCNWERGAGNLTASQTPGQLLLSFNTKTALREPGAISA